MSSPIKLCPNKKCGQPLHFQSEMGITLPYCMNESCVRYGLVTVVVGYKK